MNWCCGERLEMTGQDRMEIRSQDLGLFFEEPALSSDGTLASGGQSVLVRSVFVVRWLAFELSEAPEM